MEKIDKLLEIANLLNFTDLTVSLREIKQRSAQENADLVFPLVGEFSAGKTSLINALTDSKRLETATQPTTSTIYEIHFGCERCYATVLNEKGETTEIEDIASLKNSLLIDAVAVNIFDTSTCVPSTTVLVDTPGLSSLDPKHKQILVDFLPKADGILLVTDINQQITRSLTDFIEMIKLTKRSIYLVITKCDTKSSSEWEKVKEYISDNCKLPIQQVACVSAKENDLSELNMLFERIQKEKNSILKQVNEQRTKNIIKELSKRIDELLHLSSSDEKIEESIRRQEYELKRLNRNIDNLIERTGSDIQEKEKTIIRQFEDIISDKLESLVVGKCDNFDEAAVSLINNTSSLLFDDYKCNIEKVLCDKARECANTDDAVLLHSLTDLDLSNFSVMGLSYNLDLNSIGHEYDGVITTVTKYVAAAATVAAVVSTAGVAVAAVSKATLTNVLDAADTVSDVGSIISNQKMQGHLKKTTEFIQKTNRRLEGINDYDHQIGEKIGHSKGIVESVVGLVTDKTLGKPQRKKAIRSYMDETLLPDFKRKMECIGQQLISLISASLHKEAAETIAQKSKTLQQLKSERNEKKEAFDQQLSQLRDCKNELMTF